MTVVREGGGGSLLLKLTHPPIRSGSRKANRRMASILTVSCRYSGPRRHTRERCVATTNHHHVIMRADSLRLDIDTRRARPVQQVAHRRTQRAARFALQDIHWRRPCVATCDAGRLHWDSDKSLSGRPGGNTAPSGQIERQRQCQTARWLGRAVHRLRGRATEYTQHQ